MLTQQCLPSLLTSTVKSSLFTHAHSSPLSLAVRLHRCCTNYCHINTGWTSSGQTSFDVERVLAIALDIRGHVQERNRALVLSAGEPVVRAPPWRFTRGLTQWRNLVNVLIVVSASVRA
ncbi:zinc finger protein 572 [Phyllostomus discolor]|uniref:Zinc finger protein 572 n=1 Tax=Phyllostomus discolor TaxID=89673 RepID=A0A833ZXH8_9CHIR|nr:zinc finger protein 572 [Phyllostomus discolor]